MRGPLRTWLPRWEKPGDEALVPPIVRVDEQESAFPLRKASTGSGKEMDSKKLAQRCRELADDKKAENLVILDLRKLPGVTDFMVLCSGTSDPHLRAIEESITRKLRDDHELRPRAVDGTRHSGWIVIDYGDVLVHVMKPDVRERYDLEGLWNDAPRLKAAAARKSTRKKAKTAKVAEPGTGVGGNPS